MPVKNRHQILAKVETVQGSAATLAATDAIEVFNPDISDSYTITDRRPAGSSLSRDLEPVGRQTRTLTFTSDFRGSGSTSNPPPWGTLVRACGWDELAKRKLTLSSISGAFQHGEKVSVDADNWGIVVAPLLDTDKLHVAWIEGDVAATDSITGANSSATATVDAEAEESYVYAPSSRAEVLVSTGAWSGTAPVVGDVLTVTSNILGVGIVGAIQITEFTATGSQDFKAAVQWGTVANLNVLTDDNGVFASVDAVVSQVHTPSLTIRSNIDGFARDAVGARGDFSLTGEHGSPMQFAWTFTGQVGTHADLALATGIPVVTAAVPRLQGATIGIGDGANYLKLPTKRVELALSNTVGIRGDANQPGGIIGSVISDRDPTITVEVDMMGKNSLDVIGRLQSSTTVRFGCLLGSGSGNRMSITANRCQITNITDGDAEGIATFTIVMKPRRLRTSGDDEIFLAAI